MPKLHRPDVRLPLALLLATAAACAGARRGSVAFGDTTSGAQDRPHVALPAGTKPLTLDALYGPEGRVDFSGSPPTRIVWLDDSSYVLQRPDPKGGRPEWVVVDAATGGERPFLDEAAREQAEQAAAAIPGLGERRAPGALLSLDDMNADRSAVLITAAKDLWMYRFGAEAAVRLTETPEAEEENAAWSPDGRRVAFVRGNDLHVVDVDPVAERRLTQDGSATVLNGKLDWLYQEEVFGRGNFTAAWWSPDGEHLAYLRLDQSGVPAYTLVDDVAEPPVVETSPYPRAGETNPTWKLGVVSAGGGETGWIDAGAWAEHDPLIVDVAWSPSGRLFYQVQDREQRWLDLASIEVRAERGAAPAFGAPHVLFREETRAWVERQGSPRFLDDGSFLWTSERSGFKHLYRYRENGTLLGPVTSGRWEARALHGADLEEGWVYFSGTERSAIGSDVYRVRLDGSELTRLSALPGTHAATFSPGFDWYVDAWSDAATPTQVRLHRANGSEERVLDANEITTPAEYGFVEPEFVQVSARDGFVMEAMLIKPPGFDPRQRYPVFQHTYAGPQSPQVRDGWSGGNGFLQLLAQRGIVVWVCDNRSASGKGAEAAWTSYQRLGEQELRDIEDGVEWLRQQPWVDPDRIAISGWSYGGFMAAYALTHSRSFRCAIAGGSVTDWREYDTIYTERYMRTPQSNPDGYEATSVIRAAADLHGDLLLLHGSMDDNVHPSNTRRLAHALQEAGLPFEIQLYGQSRHGVRGAKLVRHMRETMLAFLERHLFGPPRP